MSSLQAALDGVMSVLDNDAEIGAWSLEHFQRTFRQMLDYREIKQLYDHEYPAALFYIGPATTEIEVGNHSMRVAFEIIAEFLFIEPDHDRAVARMAELPDLVIKALMRNHTLSDTIDGAWVGEWDVGNPALQPVRDMGFKIVGSYLLQNA